MFKDYLQKELEAIEKGDVDTLLKYTFDNGRRFPNSYIRFVQEYGYGLSLGLFLIYIPMGDYGDSLFVRSQEIKSTYQDALDDEDQLWFELGLSVPYAKLKNMFPFAVSENGHYLFWDLDSGSESEFDIYLTDFRGIAFTKIANNLLELFSKVTSDNFKEILPYSSAPLERVFKPLGLKN